MQINSEKTIYNGTEAKDSLNIEKDCIGLLRINAMNFESLDRGI